MNNPLLLAVLLAAPLPAAAQTDAAFSAALGKPLPGQAMMAQLKTRSQVPPAPQAQGPVAPAAAWQKLLNVVVGQGEKTVNPATQVVSYTLDKSDDVAHQTVGITAVGRTLPDGKVSVRAVLLSFGQTLALNLPSGFVVVNENWFLEVQGDGRLKKVTYIKIETAAGKTSEYAPRLEDPNSSDSKELFDDIVRIWTE